MISGDNLPAGAGRAPLTAAGKPPRVTFYDHAYETMAVQFLAAAVKSHGFHVDVFYDLSMNKDYLCQDLFFMPFLSLSARQVARGILDTKPDVVAFSLITVFYPLVSEIMREIKKAAPGVAIVCGGPHCQLAPQHVLENENIDFVGQGDADITLPALLNLLAAMPLDEVRKLAPEQIPGFSSRVDGKTIYRGFGQARADLDAAPYPLKDPYYRKNPALKKMYVTMCSRGCVFKCTYCNNNNIRRLYNDHGMKYFRVRSVDSVMDELTAAKAKWRPKSVMFIDNLFAPASGWLREFSEKYSRGVGLPFFCETNPNVHTKETMDLLADAGCTLLQFGFQSAVEDVRKEVLHRYEKNDRIRELVTHAKKRGIFVCIDHIANLPGEKLEHLREAEALYTELRPNWINLGFLQFYPQADIIDIALARKQITSSEIPAINAGQHQVSFRLVSKSSLTEFYRVLPIRLFCGFKLPAFLRKPTLWLMNFKIVQRIFARPASVFIYFSRILFAYTDRRDFMIRHHVIRNLYVLKIVLKEKYFTYGRQP